MDIFMVMKWEELIQVFWKLWQSTQLNLLLNVGFNREVAEDGAMYWSKEEGNLAGLIERADHLDQSEINKYTERARKRVCDWYSWEYISGQYEKLFLK